MTMLAWVVGGRANSHSKKLIFEALTKASVTDFLNKSEHEDHMSPRLAACVWSICRYTETSIDAIKAAQAADL